MIKEYNGHRSWAAWNVSLWLYNDESQYRLMLQAKSQFKSKRNQVKWIMEQLPPKTPDGAKYSRLTVGLALDELEG
jgi:hypothetical protein